MPPAVILGSAFTYGQLDGEALPSLSVTTPWGPVELHTWRRGYVLFRHGPQSLMAHQIPYRAHVAALATVGCRELLVTSSVGVLDSHLPLFEPLLVSDLYMPENRLPDGTLCTMFPEPGPGQGHLVLEEGLFSEMLVRRIQEHAGDLPPVTFAYVPGPRTKTPLENRVLARWGIQVNSMTLGPEVVLANELGIPTAAVVVGHKLSAGSSSQPGLAVSLEACRNPLGPLVKHFFTATHHTDFGNRLFDPVSRTWLR